MRILVIQLARFGDIYQSWPVLRALKRTHPQAEVHLLVRTRFQAATTGLNGITVHCLPTAEFIAPLLSSAEDVLSPMVKFTEDLAALKFTQIYNLSFSPASSYLTDILSEGGASVAGYTRHSDGFFSIPDDTSAYFYAQVGIGRSNRYHLTEIFAAVCGVSLHTEDFNENKAFTREHRVLVHIGASQIEKAYPAELWGEALKTLRDIYDGEVILIGSRDERVMADAIAQISGASNRVGETTLPELQNLIATSELLIGADSAPIHMATLTATKVLNLSSDTVSFWETGPMGAGSRVLHEKTIAQIAPGRVAAEALALIDGRPPQGPSYERHADGFIAVGKDDADFNWQLIQALYTGSEYPKTTDNGALIAFQRLFELAELALTQLARWQESKSTAAQILARVDEMLEELPRLNGHVVPVIQWFQTQRLRLPPGSESETLQATRKLFEELLWIAAVYRPQRSFEDEATRAAQLCAQLAPRLREFEFHAVESEFQTMVASFHELARHSTKVGARAWSSVLADLNAALDRRDLIELADQLEFELQAQMETMASGG
jgi:ADP-heptose:LPS heptosyltransferase